MPHTLTTQSSLSCPHGGTIIGTPKAPKVSFGGAPALTKGDSFQIIGCSFTLPGGKPSPCMTIEWVTTDSKFQTGDQSTLSEASVGLCKADTGAPQGSVSVSSTQTVGETA
jgi:hypothetical protein